MTPTTPPRPATRADVARLAGVSTAVVSYVVNDGPRPVAPATRERVLHAIQSLGYRPNASARALKLGSTSLLGLVLSEIINPFHSEWIDAIDTAASRRGYSLLLASSHGDRDRERLLRESLVERGVEGMLFLSVFPDAEPDSSPLPDTGLPRLILDRSHPTQGFSTVGADAIAGSMLATQHLIEHGHTRIAYVEGPLNPIVGTDRRTGWELALHGAGIQPSAPVVTEWSRAGGAQAVQRLFERPDPPTAIFAGSDLIAIGVLQALHARGLRIPEDMAVVSFDGTAESEYSWPALTTVRQPFREMADSAIDVLTGSSATPQSVVLPMSLIARASCGCTAH